ncbi:MAG TPA: hypothetical protein VNT31_15975 [Nocardioides sp.]|nr:hypothetical protein [Nocardioides sp.]
MRRPNPRARLRRTLLLAGLAPALLVLLFGLKVVLLLQGNAAGRDAFVRGDYDGAAEEFAGTRSLNWIEPWVAPFDHGASLHAHGSYAEAVTAYGTALEDVPEKEECTVRINLALAHEAIGDEQAADQDVDGAIESWQEGVDVLAEGDCPADSGRGEEQTEDAEALDRRLREKIEQGEQEQQPQGQPPQQPQAPGEQPDDGQDPRQERLERNNEQGRSQRSDEQDLYEDEDFTRPNTW